MPSTPKGPQDHKKKTTKKYGSGWKNQLTDLELPSGEVCQVKRPGVQKLIQEGVLQSMDTLTSIVQTETIPRAEGRPVEATDAAVKSILEDSDKFDKMMDAVDRIVEFVVVQPKVVRDIVTQAMVDSGEFAVTDLGRHLTDEERDDDLIYTDYIDPMDKMFIMNFAVGGSSSLAQFRAESQDALGGLSAG